MKKPLGLVLFLAGFAGLTAAAQADVANFQARCTWNATNTAFTCNFDASRPTSDPSSCTNGTPPEFRWKFGDGGGWTSWKPAWIWTIDHTYAAPPPGVYGYVAELEIRCFETVASYTYADTARYICVFGLGTGGCIQVNGTWN